MVAVERIGGSAKGKGGQLFGAMVNVNTFEVDTLLRATIRAASPVSLQFFGEKVADYLEGRVVNRFAVEGDSASGNWQPLRPTTERIRASMGYGPDGPINMRTDELFRWAAYTADVEQLPGVGVQVTKPDVNSMGEVALAKLKTAQKGNDNNVMLPGAVTPPRPVVALDSSDTVRIMKMLQIHIMNATVRQVAWGAFT
jgi:hypothetical protein